MTTANLLHHTKLSSRKYYPVFIQYADLIFHKIAMAIKAILRPITAFHGLPIYYHSDFQNRSRDVFLQD